MTDLEITQDDKFAYLVLTFPHDDKKELASFVRDEGKNTKTYSELRKKYKIWKLG